MGKGCLGVPSSEKEGEERGGELGPQVLKALVGVQSKNGIGFHLGGRV